MNSTRVTEVVEALKNAYVTAIETAGEKRPELMNVNIKDANEGIQTLEKIKQCICTIAKGTQVEGIIISNFNMSYRVTEDENGGIAYVDVAVRTSRNSIPYVNKVRLTNDVNFFEQMAVTLILSLVAIYKKQIAVENVAELNNLLESIYAEHEITAGFKFAVSDTDYIVSIDDNTVVFGVTPDKATEIYRLDVFRSGTEWEDACRVQAIENIVSALKSAGTTVKIVKSKLNIVDTLTEFKSKKRVDSLIRLAVHKRAQYICNNSVGYVEDRVQIDGKTVDVFALVGKDAEGEYSVVLKPFDVHTLFNVEYDAIKAVKEAKE